MHQLQNTRMQFLLFGIPLLSALRRDCIFRDGMDNNVHNIPVAQLLLSVPHEILLLHHLFLPLLLILHVPGLPDIL